MHKKIVLGGQAIDYQHKRNRRTKRMTITVRRDGSVLVTTPHIFPVALVERGMQRQVYWITQKVTEYKDSPTSLFHTNSAEEYKKYKTKAHTFIQQKVEKFNQFYHFSYNKITIRRQTTMWGSCSKKGNLNFNYKLYFLPDYLVEYIVVHELCHLQELNHSPQFWKLVAQAIPDWKERMRELKRRF